MMVSRASKVGGGLEKGFSKQDLLSLHRFVFKGKRIVYDMNSCAALEVDKITWDVLEALGGSKEAVAKLHRRHDERSILEVVAQLHELKNSGTLFSGIQLPPTTTNRPNATTHLVLLMTYGCNLDCRYCYTKEEPYAGRHTPMNAATAEKAVDFLIQKSGQENNLFVVFFGGEPLLNFRVIQRTVEYAKTQAGLFHKNIQFSLTTNAVLLTREVRRFLNENHICIVASFDGPSGLHDVQRPARNGGGSHAKALANLQELLQTRGPYGIFIRSTFTRHTIDSVSDVVTYLLQLGFRDISIEPAILSFDHGDAFRTEDLPQVRQAYAGLAEMYLHELMNRNVFLLLQFTYVMERLHAPRRCFARCDAGGGTMAVSPTGELYPCIKLVEADEHKLGSVLDRRVNRRIQKLFQSLQVQNKNACKLCWAKYICGGGCHAHGLKYGHDLLGVNEVECHFIQCWLELGMWLYATLSKDAPNILDSVLELETNRRKSSP